MSDSSAFTFDVALVASVTITANSVDDARDILAARLGAVPSEVGIALGDGTVLDVVDLIGDAVTAECMAMDGLPVYPADDPRWTETAEEEAERGRIMKSLRAKALAAKL